MHHLSLTGALAAGLLLPFTIQAVKFTNSDFNGVEAGKDYKLTWSGDGSVRAPLPPLAQKVPKEESTRKRNQD